MSNSVRLIRSDKLAITEYAYAAIPETDARLVFLAGACPLALDGTTIAPGDYAAQAAAALANLTIALEAAGATLLDVVQTRVLVASTDRNDLGVVWDVVRAGFGDHDVPSTLMGVSVLGYADQLVELDAVAVLPRVG